MNKTASELRNAADLIRRGDLFAPTDRAKFPRNLPDAYEAIALLLDRVDNYTDLIEALGRRIGKLEHANDPRTIRSNRPPTFGS